MSGEWLRCAQELGIDVVGLVDVRLEAAQEKAKEFSLNAPLLTDYGKAIRDIPADVIFDCTIPAVHKEVASTALRTGLHVVEEKPLALTLEDGAELVRLARAAGKFHVITQNRRFTRGIRLLRSMIAEGAIGEVTAVHTDFFIGPHFGGFREQMRHVLLADMAIHPFDAIRFLLQGNAESVFCEEWTPKNSWYEHGCTVVAIFRMAKQVRFTYRASWCADGFRSSWDASWRIVGTEGTLFWDGLEDVRAERLRFTPGAFLNDAETILPRSEPDPAETRGHFSVMRQFVEALRGGAPPETRSEDNIHSLAMVIAAIESAESGERVEVSAPGEHSK
jgi:predicted dehydrogenase